MYDAAFTPWETLDKPGLIAAAALRAAADQVVPVEPEPQWWEPVRPRFSRQCIRRRLLAIAAELEAQ